MRPISSINLALNRAQSAGSSEYSPADNANLTAWLDAQTRTRWTLASPPAIDQALSDLPFTYGADKGTGGPSIVQVNSLDMMEFANNEVLHGTAGSAATVQPGSGDFTITAVFRSAATARAMIWWKPDGGKRWMLRIATGGSDIEWSVDDDTTAQTLVANDVDFANDDIYVVMAIRRGTDLEFYYGNGGALTTSAASPKSLGGSYGDLGASQSWIGAESDSSPTQELLGEIGELLFHKGEALDSSGRADLYNYLIARWDL